MRLLSACCALFSCSTTLALDTSLDASQYAHTSWKVSDGFCKGAIHQIVQSSDGYLWLATEFGLLRFDGVRAAPWQPPPGERLPSNDIRSLTVGRDGTLWLGTAKGLVSWKSGRLTHYPQLDGYDVHHVFEDHERAVWAAGTIWEAGISPKGTATLCSITNGGTECFGGDGSFGPFGVTAIQEDGRGNLWLGASNGIWRWRPGPPQHYDPPQLETFGVGGLIFPPRALLDEQDGALLIAGPRGIYRFVNGELKSFPLPSTVDQLRDRELLRDRNGGLWIGSLGSGLLHLHQGRMDSYNQADGLSTNFIENLFEDREGNIWIATRSGLDRFREYTVPTISTKQGLSSSFVRSVLADRDGSVWLATPNGLNRWKGGQITIYDSGSGLPDKDVGSLYQEENGTLWVSTARGLARFDNGRFVGLPGVKIPSWSLSPVARDKAGNLWLTSDQGLYRLSGGRVAEYLPSERVGLRGLLSTLLATDPVRGGFWLASWEGGVVYFKDGKVRESFGPVNGLGEGRVNDLELDRANAIWAATDSGLSRIQNGRVSNLTVKNGLPCDTVHSVIEDDAHSLWLYTACGLVRIAQPQLEAWIADPNRRIQVAVFDLSDGVKSHAGVYNFAPRMAKATDGRIWFVPLDGVAVVDPRHLPSNSLPPPVHIEQIQANGKSYGLGANNRIRLPAHIRDLTIDYTALSFAAPEKVRFRFKLEGQDKEWREALNDRQVQYSNLAPGAYRFRVIASNNSGLWNEQGDTLDFSVDPAFYQTKWFFVLTAGVAGALLWSVHRVRVRAVHERNRELAAQVTARTAAADEIRALTERLINAQEEERARVARELHDDLSQEIAAISVSLSALQNKYGDHRSAREFQNVRSYVMKVASTVRDLSHELHPAFLDYCELPVALKSYCREFAKLSGLEITLESAGSFEQVPPALTLCLYRVAQEALRNVAKHAGANSATVHLARSTSSITLAVSDTGIGFRPDQARAAGGLGLISIRERVSLLKGALQVDSAPNRGTKVTVEIPLVAAMTEVTAERQ